MATPQIIWKKSSGPKLTGQSDLSLSGEIIDEYDILVNESPKDFGNLRVAGLLPGNMFDRHPDSAMFVQTYRDVQFIQKVTQPGFGFLWRGEVRYTRRPRSRAETPSPPNAATPYSISFSFNNRTEVLEVDRYGVVVANTLNERFTTPPQARVNEPTFTISRQEAWNPIQKLMDYNPKYGAVNGDGIWYFAPRTLLLQIGAEYNSDNGWNVRYQFSFNYDTWDYAALNVSFNEKANGVIQRILDQTPDKRPVQQPKAITREGTVVPENSDGYWLFWEKAEPMNFYALNLPDITTVW